MNPWLLGALALGVVGLAAASGSAASTTSAPALPYAPQAVATGGGDPALTHANIMAAFKVALKHETNVERLALFGNALIAYGGYVAQGGALTAKSARMMLAQDLAHANAPSHPSAAPSHASAPPQNVSYWVQHFTGVRAEHPSQSQIAKAVHAAMQHGSPDEVVAFAEVLQKAGDKSDASELQHQATSAEEKLLQPFVKKFVGTDTVDEHTLAQAIMAAKHKGTMDDLVKFGGVLLAAPELFGKNWNADGAELMGMAPVRGAAEHQG